MNRFLQIDILIELGIEDNYPSPTKERTQNEIYEGNHDSFGDFNIGDYGDRQHFPGRDPNPAPNPEGQPNSPGEPTSTSQPHPTDLAEPRGFAGGGNHYPRSYSEPVSLSADQPIPCSHAVSNEGRALHR